MVRRFRLQAPAGFGSSTVRPRAVALGRARECSPAMLLPHGRVLGVLLQSLPPAHSSGAAAAVVPLGVPAVWTTRPRSVARSRRRCRGRRERARPRAWDGATFVDGAGRPPGGRVDLFCCVVRVSDPEASGGDRCALGYSPARRPCPLGAGRATRPSAVASGVEESKGSCGGLDPPVWGAELPRDAVDEREPRARAGVRHDVNFAKDVL